jgi:hypothetical protein
MIQTLKHSIVSWGNFNASNILRENSLYPLKFLGFFNFNPKVSKSAIYPPNASKSGNLNLPLIFSLKLDKNI